MWFILGVLLGIVVGFIGGFIMFLHAAQKVVNVILSELLKQVV